MKKIILLILLSVNAFSADVKISDLPLGSAASTGVNDSFPYVDAGVGTTKRLKVTDLKNVPSIATTYAPIASPVFTGSVTAPSFIGALSGSVTGTAANITGNLARAQVAAGTPSSILKNDVSGLMDVVANGTDGQVLSMVGGVPSFSDIPTNATLHVIPTSNNLYDLGSASKFFRNLYLGTNLYSGAYAFSGADIMRLRNIAYRDGDTHASPAQNKDLLVYNGSQWLPQAEEAHWEAGAISPPTYTDLGTGSITVNATDVFLFDNATNSGVPRKYTLAQQTLALTDLVTNYIVGDYNTGTPIIKVITNVQLINESDVIPLMTIFRNGTVLHTQNWDSLGAGLSNKLNMSIVKTSRYRRESGLALGETGTRNVSVTSGVMWVAAVRVPLDVIDTTTDNIFYFSKTGGVWSGSTVHQYNNTQYSDGTDTQTLSAGRYAVNFIYRGVETQKHTYMVLGVGNNTLSNAQALQPPSDLPINITSHAVLVGRIIVLKNAATATQIDSAFVTIFSNSPATNHNDLSLIQGGTTGEYYHHTLVEHTQLTGAITKFTDTATLDSTHANVWCNKASPMTINLPTVSGIANRQYVITNVGTGVCTIDPSGAETIDGTATKALSQYTSARIQTDGATWVTISAKSVGGGGGTSLIWSNDAPYASEEVTFNSQKAYKFTKGESQKIKAVFKVPSTYVTGSQLFLKLGIAGDTATNIVSGKLTADLQGTGSLAAPQATGSDTQDVTVTAINKAYIGTFAITGATGLIGAVQVVANDVILLTIETYDANYTNTGAMYVLPSTGEVL